MTSTFILTLTRWVLAPIALLGAAALATLNYGRQPVGRRPLLLLRLVFIAGLAVLVWAPTLRWQVNETHRPRLRILIDASRSMGLDDGTGKARIERARARAAELATVYGGRFLVETYAFGRELTRVPDLAKLAADQPASDLSTALRQLTGATGQDQVRATFLLTDGVHTSSTTPVGWARTSESPIHTVAVGKESYPFQDIVVDQVQAPQVAFRESSVVISARVRGFGAHKGQRLPVTLTLGGRVIAETSAELASGTAQVRFTFKPERGGLATYRIAAPAFPGELSAANNQADVTVQIEDKQRDVLLISCSPGWESAFLRRAVTRDPRFKLEARELLKRGAVHDFTGPDLARFPLVILHHFQAKSLRAPQIQALVEYVTRSDGSLLVLGTGVDNVDELTASELARILPVGKSAGRWDGSRRLNLVLTSLGQRHPACAVLPHPQANLLAWKNLPPVVPAALFPVEGDGATAGPVLVAFPFYPSDIAAVSYRTIGRGLTVFVNTAQTHLLGLMPAAADDRDRLHESFMANMMDWMTDPARGSGVALTLSRVRFAEGEPIEIGVNDYQDVLGAGDVTVNVADDVRGAAVQVKLARAAEGISGQFTPAQTGTYTLTLPVPDRPAVTRRIVVEDSSHELEVPFADHGLLRELAAASGGAFFPEADAGLTSVGLDATPITHTFSSSLTWLDEGRLMTILLTLLCVEWILRRRWNLL